MSSLCTIGGTSEPRLFLLGQFCNYYLFVDRPNLYVQPVVVLFFRSRKQPSLLQQAAPTRMTKFATTSILCTMISLLSTRSVIAFSRSSSFTRSTNVARRSYSSTTLSMRLQTAIVGLPNVGKSTLFNALTETQGAEAAK